MVEISAIKTAVKLTEMNCLQECRCCSSAEDLEELWGPAFDVYSLIRHPQGMENGNIRIFTCLHCRRFLEKVHRFRIENYPVHELSYNNLNVIPHKNELMLRNTTGENLSQIGIKTEVIGEFNEINRVDIEFVKVEVDCNAEKLQQTSHRDETQKHLKNFTKPHKCNECSYKSKNLRDLRRHAACKHSKEKPFSCDLCNYRSNIKDNLLIHMRKHLSDDDNPYKCSECSFKTTTMKDLRRHVACKHSEEKRFSCDHCNYRSNRKDYISSHMKKHSKDGNKLHKCNECSYKTTTEYNLKTHFVCKHSDEKALFCDQCSYRCKLKSSLVTHRKIHLKNCEMPYECSEYTSTTLNNLNEIPISYVRCNFRRRSKAPSEDFGKPYKCSECSYESKNLRDLKRHVACKHSQEKPFSCDQCDYRSSIKDHLLIHMRKHLSDTDNPYKCSECSFKTTTMKDLRRHIACKHSEEKPFACDRCKYRSNRKDYLTSHMKIHMSDSDKPFKCNECSYKTTTENYLKNHVASKHRDEEPFSCDRCNYRCKIINALRKHQKKHIKECE